MPLLPTGGFPSRIIIVKYVKYFLSQVTINKVALFRRFFKIQMVGTLLFENVLFFLNTNMDTLAVFPLQRGDRTVYGINSVNVWCGICSEGVIGPHYIEREGQSALLSALQYSELVRNFLLPELQRLNFQHLTFQQDGSTPHVTASNIEQLRQNFGASMISRFGDELEWPSRSTEYTPTDHFLWPHLRKTI